VKMTNEKFCLQWNEFESNISTAFRELRDDKDFFDVTLACDDDQIQAHKVILSACSPFFRNILRRNSHPNPFLYLKGIKFTDLQYVLNFMYHGEVNVGQEELNSFLAVAEDLKIKGLTQNLPKESVNKRNEVKASSVTPMVPKSSYHHQDRHTDIPKYQRQVQGCIFFLNVCFFPNGTKYLSVPFLSAFLLMHDFSFVENMLDFLNVPKFFCNNGSIFPTKKYLLF
jgi:hypothetical protein